MKFNNLKDIDGFFNAVSKCKGKVELVTQDGDRLNLKSKLCQYVSFAKLIADKENGIKEMEVVAYDPEDIGLLASYMLYGTC